MDYAIQMLHTQRESASQERAAQIVAAVKQLHVDEMSPGTKVSFVKRFSGSKDYTYLALKTHDVIDGIGMDRWYVTGKSRKYTNSEFEDLLAEKLGFEDFQLLFPSAALKVPASYASPQPETWKGWTGASAKPEYEIPPLKGWGADVNPALPQKGKAAPLDPESDSYPQSTHAVGPQMDGEEDPE